MGWKLASFITLWYTCLWLPTPVIPCEVRASPHSTKRGNKAKAMLTDEEFRAWCQHNHFSPETEATIQRIRSSQPARKVQSRASNVSGRYPSVKMGFSIQFESQHVELWGIHMMERDDDVLEFYDQPTRIQLHYQARSG